MNNYFNLKRFCNYFVYDLRHAKNNYALSLLIMGLMPIVLFIFLQAIGLIFNQELINVSMPPKYVQMVIVTTVVLFGAGVKIYGKITEKRTGSSFLMLPASTLEKWLSMVLVTCIVLPVALYALQIASDALMSFLFPNLYGERLYNMTLLQTIEDKMAGEGVSVNMGALLFWNWVESILTFTLGAIFFKKSKIAKTLLCLIGISFLISGVAMIYLNTNPSDTPFGNFDSAEQFVSYFNWMTNISLFVIVGGLLAGMYFRIRTLKH